MEPSLPAGNLALWGGLCAAGLAAIQLLQYTFDRHEKCAVLELELDRVQKQIELDLDKEMDGGFNGLDDSGDDSGFNAGVRKDPGSAVNKDISDDAMVTLQDTTSRDHMMQRFQITSDQVGPPAGRNLGQFAGPIHDNVVATRMGGLEPGAE